MRIWIPVSIFWPTGWNTFPWVPGCSLTYWREWFSNLPLALLSNCSYSPLEWQCLRWISVFNSHLATVSGFRLVKGWVPFRIRAGLPRFIPGWSDWSLLFCWGCSPWSSALFIVCPPPDSMRTSLHRTSPETTRVLVCSWCWGFQKHQSWFW